MKKVIFLSVISPFDVSNWSGTLLSISNTLSEEYIVEWIGGDT